MKPTSKSSWRYQKKTLRSTMKEIEKYLESQRALDENGKPDTSLFGVKMYKSLKAAKISTKLYEGSSGYYIADGGTTILMGDILIYFRST